jgi:hypothetical protein
MNNQKYMKKIPPLSSRPNKNQSIPLLFLKINIERNQKNSSVKKFQSLEQDSPFLSNKYNSSRKISKSSSSDQLKLYNNRNFHNNIYKNIPLINLFSFNKNSASIRQMVQEKKYQNIRNIYSEFFNSPFNNEYMSDINRLKKRNILIPNIHYKLISMKRNNSCQDLLDVKIKLKTAMKNEDSTPRLSTNYSKALNINKNKKKINQYNYIRNNFSSNLSTGTNKSLISIKFPTRQSNNSSLKISEESLTTNQNIISLPKLPLMKSSSLKSAESESEKIILENPKKEESFITGLGVDKMKFNINRLIAEKTKNKEKIDEYEEKILKLKICQSYQKERLKKLLNNKKYNIQERIDHIIQMYYKYEKIYEEYMESVSRYNNFLFKVSNELDIELRIISKQKHDMNYNLEILVNKIVDKQKEYENVISMRNFLFFAKNRDKKIIKMDNLYIYRISNRRKFVGKLFDILGRTQDSFAFKYLKKIIPLDHLEKIIHLATHKPTVKIRRGNTIKRTVRVSVEKPKEDINLLTPPSPGEKIFETPEDFIKVIENMTTNDLKLMKKYEKICLENSELKDELEEINALYEKFEKSDMNDYLMKDKKYLQDAKQKHIELSQRYKYLSDLATKRKELSSLQLDLKIFSYKSHNNIYFYNKIKYNKLRVKYKLEGLVLLEKLISSIKLILSLNKKLKIFSIKDIFHYIPRNILRQILELKVDYFNKDNQYLINEYTLKLLKLLEFFGEFITNKNERRKNMDKQVYNKIKENIQNERKIYNAQTIKQMVVEKREGTIKELMEKWNKKIIKKKQEPIIIRKKLNKSLEIKSDRDKIIEDLEENILF